MGRRTITLDNGTRIVAEGDEIVAECVLKRVGDRASALFGIGKWLITGR